MASGATNWVHDKGIVTDKDKIALERAKKIERRLEKKGYRWIKITDKLQVFVPCDANGNPTIEGQRKIATLKQSQGIK